MPSVDVIGATVVFIALFRGFFLGLVREAFSLGSIAAAVLLGKLLARPFGAWLAAHSGGRIPGSLGPWVAGAVLGVIAIAGVTSVGRALRRGLRAAGMRWFDRLAGAALGGAEGILVVCLMVAVGARFLGRDHASLAGSKSLAALETVEGLLAERGLPHRLPVDVAAPPPRRHQARPGS